MSQILNTLYLALLFLCANEFLNLGWEWRIAGKFNIADVGLLLIAIGLAFSILNRGTAILTDGPIAILIWVYSVIVATQISLASIYYSQPLMDGLVGVRHQFYIYSYFLFRYVLTDRQSMRRALNVISFLAVVAVIAGVANYFSPGILAHKWAEGHGMRGGITRAFIPGMALVSVGCLWEAAKWSADRRLFSPRAILMVFLMGGHIFRQSRMRLFSVIAGWLYGLAVQRRWGAIIVILIMGVAAIQTAGMVAGENPVSSLFSGAVQDVVEKEGTWAPRMDQLRFDLDEFFEHPVIGSGASGLRAGSGSIWNPELAILAYRSDLGYTRWLRSYGILGAIWLIVFLGVFVRATFRIHKQKSDDCLEIMVASFTMFFLVSLITINHLMFPRTLILVMLMAALIPGVAETAPYPSRKRRRQVNMTRWQPRLSEK